VKTFFFNPEVISAGHVPLPCDREISFFFFLFFSFFLSLLCFFFPWLEIARSRRTTFPSEETPLPPRTTTLSHFDAAKGLSPPPPNHNRGFCAGKIVLPFTLRLFLKNVLPLLFPSGHSGGRFALFPPSRPWIGRSPLDFASLFFLRQDSPPFPPPFLFLTLLPQLRPSLSLVRKVISQASLSPCFSFQADQFASSHSPTVPPAVGTNLLVLFG